MATFVFIHGSFQGAWCWRGIMPQLESKGHRTLAIDLPGHGNDSARKDVSLEDYVEAVVQVVRPLSDRPILVGHSMGGAVNSLVAEAIPDRIQALVYVTGLLLPDGSSMLETIGALDPQYLAQMIWAPDRSSARPSSEGAIHYFYPLCPLNLVHEILPLITSEPIAPLEPPIRTTPERFGRVPRYYVECLQDRVLPIGLQRSMHSAIPCKGVYSIDCDHSPYLSAPSELTAILRLIAGEA